MEQCNCWPYCRNFGDNFAFIAETETLSETSEMQLTHHGAIAQNGKHIKRLLILVQLRVKYELTGFK
jgi:hypothetical protein